MSDEIKKDLQEEMQDQETEESIEDGKADAAAGQEADAEEIQEEHDRAEADEKGDADAENKEDKKSGKKKLKFDKKQDAMKEKINKLKNQIKRQMAEFENFRKRTEKEKAAMFETGAKSVIEKILPVVDNFERGLATIPEEEKGSAFAEGMEMIYKQLLGELEKMDVKPIQAVGEEFNPDFHNAVMQVESEEYESGVVAQELLKGYTYRDSVVRHSMVAVVS